jgi:hypothetical protein
MFFITNTIELEKTCPELSQSQIGKCESEKLNNLFLNLLLFNFINSF